MKVAPSMLRRFGSIEPNGSRVVLPAFHPAVRGGRSIFASRVFDVDEVDRLLKSGHNSRKIGSFVTKGPRRGWPIFTLTLEERATCPRTCKEYLTCFGNNMQAAERITHGAEMEAQLMRELAGLQREHPAGFMVRLHVLGDFYSEDYVAMWSEALDRFPALHVFGFTARLPGTSIGDAIMSLAEEDWERFAIRFSGADLPEKASEVLALGDDSQHVICPAQTGATQTCGTCALCWHSRRNIAFRRH